ncbi:MAG: 2-iminoacetate synthase ThiH [bacterium]
MSFIDILNKTAVEQLRQQLDDIPPDRVETALNHNALSFSDFLALISPAAADYMEEMAVKARKITLQRFGRIILLYAPLYLSNECSNACLYCGFNVHRRLPRITLSMDEIIAEAGHLKNIGFAHLLLVSGEASKVLPVPRLQEILKVLSKDFPSLSLEIYPLSAPAYAQLAEAGADGLTLYQETYNRDVYAKVHPGGRKRDYNWRLEAVERAAEVGFRRLGIGSLLGLNDWRYEGIALAVHAEYLMKKYWKTQLAISFPRLINTPEGFSVPAPVDDASMVQLMLALRLYLHDAGLVLSTREPPQLRDHLIPLGITQMSAGSRTEPGGYLHPVENGSQFSVEDHRKPAEVAAAIQRNGYEPVWKDWDQVMHEGYTDGSYRQRDAQGHI